MVDRKLGFVDDMILVIGPQPRQLRRKRAVDLAPVPAELLGVRSGLFFSRPMRTIMVSSQREIATVDHQGRAVT